jgi:hypothetical protein
MTTLFSLFFVLIISYDDHAIIQVNAENCADAVTITREETSDNYLVLSDCLGRTDLELETLGNYAGIL